LGLLGTGTPHVSRKPPVYGCYPLLPPRVVSTLGSRLRASGFREYWVPGVLGSRRTGFRAYWVPDLLGSGLTGFQAYRVRVYWVPRFMSTGSCVPGFLRSGAPGLRRSGVSPPSPPLQRAVDGHMPEEGGLLWLPRSALCEPSSFEADVGEQVGQGICEAVGKTSSVPLENGFCPLFSK